jgi:WD40 repeat protein
MFSDDSRQLASASIDGTVKIWDGETGKCIQTFGGHSGSNIALYPTGPYLFTRLGIVALRQVSSVDGIATESGNATMTAETAARPDGVETGAEPRWGGYSLHWDSSWITYHRENVLWLPLEYRPVLFDIAGGPMGIGCVNRRVLVTRFSPSCRYDKSS